MWPQFVRDPNGPFKIDERKLPRRLSSTSQSSSSNNGPSTIIAHPSRPLIGGLVVNPIQVELRTPPQQLASPSPVQTFIARPRINSSGPPSPASVRSEPSPRHARFGITPPPPVPNAPPAWRPRDRESPQTTLRRPTSSRGPIDSRSDPGSVRSSGSRGSAKTSQSNRGHTRTSSSSTVSTAGSDSSKQSDGRTPPTTVSGASSKRSSRLLEAPPNRLPPRILEEQIEYVDDHGKRIYRYRHA